MERKIAVGLLVFLSLISLAFGARYLFTAHLMNYHLSYLQMAEVQLNEVDHRIVSLFLVLIRITGGCMIAVGASSLVITLSPFRRGEPWAWWTLLALYVIPLVTLIVTTYPVAHEISRGPRPPWWLAMWMLGFLAVALFLSPPKKRTT
jgi:hypothetical protein